MDDEKRLNDYLKWIVDSEACNLWEVQDAFENKKDFKIIKQILGEKQAIFLRGLIKHINYALFEWHNESDEESHADLRSKLNKIDARLRNHRHETSKEYSGKAEF